MTAGDGPPPVLPSAVDADYECVLVDPRAAAAPPAEPGTTSEAAPAAPLCPPGYVPRLRRRAPYDLRGKGIVASDPPERNPEPPPRTRPNG